MKFILILLALAGNAYAINTPRIEIENNDKLLMHKKNNLAVDSAETINNNIDGVYASYKSCADSGNLYLGDDATDLNDEDCYDIDKAGLDTVDFRPVFEGYLSGGPYRFDNGGNGLQGRFAADAACNAEYPGTRAMVYDDVKYINREMCNSTTCPTTTVWVFDAVLSYYRKATNLMLTKHKEYAQSEVYDCDGWQTTSGTRQGMVLQKTVDTLTFFNVGYQLCSATAEIACVHN